MDDKFSVDFKTSDHSDFGYLILNGIMLLIYVEDANYYYKTKISKIVVDLFAKNFYDGQEYSIKYLENLVYRVDDDFKEYKSKKVDLKYLSCSILAIISDFNTIIAVSIGNARLSLVRDGTTIFQSKLDNVAQELVDKNELSIDEMNSNVYKYNLTNTLGGIDNLKLNLIGPLELIENDKIVIQGIKACENTEYKLANDTVIIIVNSTTANSKIINKHVFKKEYLKFLSAFLIFFSLCLFYFINSYRITTYKNKIDDANKELLIYLKNIDVQNIKRNIESLEIIYKKIDNSKTLYLNKTISQKFELDKIKIEKIKKDLDIIIDIKEDLYKAKNFYNKNEYLESNSRYKSAKLKYTNYKLEYIKLMDEIENGLKITESFLQVNEKEEKADLYFENKQYYDALKIYMEILHIYEKNGKQSYVNIVLKEKIDLCKVELEKIENQVNNLVQQAELFETTDYKKAIEIYKQILKTYSALNKTELIEKIQDKIKVLEADTLLLKNRALALKEEALIYYKTKKFKSAIECYLEANILLKKIGLIDEISSDLEDIKRIKNLLWESENIKKSAPKVDNRGLIVSSINSSIKKGDEYMKNNDWSNAIIEYQRAITFSKKINMDTDKINKLKEKLAYAIKKSNTSWWSNWI